MKTRRERLLLILFAVTFIYALTIKDNISNALTAYFVEDNPVVVAATHTHKGEYTGGPYAGWYADANSHWVKCSCGVSVKGIGSSALGTNTHNWSGNKCTTCGYTHTHKGEYTGGPYAGWYADANSHWVKCSCGVSVKGIGSSAQGTNTHNWSGNKCTTCGYTKTVTTPQTTTPTTTTTQKPTTTTHTHKGTIGGSYAGWIADANYHWVKCSCGEKIKALNTSVLGTTAHRWSGDKCTTCGYPKPVTSGTTPSTSTQTNECTLEVVVEGGYIFGDGQKLSSTKISGIINKPITVSTFPQSDEYKFVGWEIISGNVKQTQDTLGFAVFAVENGNGKVKAKYAKEESKSTECTLEVLVEGGYIYASNQKLSSTKISGTINKPITVSTFPQSDEYKFIGWEIISGNVKQTQDTFGFAVFVVENGNGKVKAKYAKASEKEYKITVTKTGSGTVTPTSGKGIKDQIITLTATPGNNNEFKGWKLKSGDAEILTPNELTTMVKIKNSNATIQAVFATKKIYRVTIQKQGSGSVAVTPQSAYSGTEVTVQAKPAKNYVFAGWEVVSGNVTLNSSNKETSALSPVTNTATLILPASNVTVKAKFVKGDSNNTVSTTAHRIKYGPESTNGMFTDKTYHWIECAEEQCAGKKFIYKNASGPYNGSNLKEGQQKHQVNSTTGKCVTCLLQVKEAKEYKITAKVNNKNYGSITVDKTSAKAGDIITITAIPSNGYVLDKITGITLNSDGKTFTMPSQNITIIARFNQSTSTQVAKEYTIKVSSSIKNGFVYTDKTKAKAGDSVEVTATPITGYELSKYTGITLNADGKTFTMPSRNVTIGATFSKIKVDSTKREYAIDVLSTVKNGKVIVNRNSAVAGEMIEVSAVPDAGYELVKYTGITLNSDGITFTMPAKAVKIGATFSKIKDTDSANKEEQCKVTIKNVYSSYGEVYVDGVKVDKQEIRNVSKNTSITLSAKAKSGYVFKEWYSNMNNITLQDKNKDSISYIAINKLDTLWPVFEKVDTNIEEGINRVVTYSIYDDEGNSLEYLGHREETKKSGSKNNKHGYALEREYAHKTWTFLRFEVPANLDYSIKENKLTTDIIYTMPNEDIEIKAIYKHYCEYSKYKYDKSTGEHYRVCENGCGKELDRAKCTTYNASGKCIYCGQLSTLKAVKVNSYVPNYSGKMVGVKDVSMSAHRYPGKTVTLTAPEKINNGAGVKNIVYYYFVGWEAPEDLKYTTTGRKITFTMPDKEVDLKIRYEEKSNSNSGAGGSFASTEDQTKNDVKVSTYVPGISEDLSTYNKLDKSNQKSGNTITLSAKASFTTAKGVMADVTGIKYSFNTWEGYENLENVKFSNNNRTIKFTMPKSDVNLKVRYEHVCAPNYYLETKKDDSDKINYHYSKCACGKTSELELCTYNDNQTKCSVCKKSGSNLVAQTIAVDENGKKISIFKNSSLNIKDQKAMPGWDVNITAPQTGKDMEGNEYTFVRWADADKAKVSSDGRTITFDMPYSSCTLKVVYKLK